MTRNDPQHEARRGAGLPAEPEYAHPVHAYPDDPIRRNLDAVRTGAMVHDPGMDRTLLRMGLVRHNSRGWLSLTPQGRAALDRFALMDWYSTLTVEDKQRANALGVGLSE